VIHNLFVTAVAFIVLVGVMVVVHEFGHFIVAKLCGVRVEAFSVGFGPRLFGVKHGDTDYKVCLLPLGGFVKMTGENPGDEPTLNDPGAFMAHPRWQRMLIGFAGPIANFILAFVLMIFYFGFINEVPDIKVTRIEWVTPGSIADQAGLRAGDIIRRFDNLNDPDVATFTDRINDVQNQNIPVTVERAGKIVEASLRVPGGLKPNELELSPAGIFVQYESGPIGIEQISPGSPADQAGLKAHDAIAAVDGHAFHTVPTLLDYMKSGQGKAISLTVMRDGAELPPVTVHPFQQDAQWRLGFIPSQPPDIPVRTQPMKFSAAIDSSKDFCGENSQMIVKVLQRLLTRKVSVKQLSGPVGIAVAAGQAAQAKEWYPKFGLAASISLNLGILNLLPFPILDGGLIIMLMIESVMRRDISLIVKERIYQAAFVVLVGFFAFIMFNDVSKLQLFSHLKP
jgi:regulator of sigma E protease